MTNKGLPALAARVVSYDAATHCCTAQAVFEVDGPPFADIPVCWPGPLAAGDNVLLVFSNNRPSRWWSAPGVQAGSRLHAIAIPGLAPVTTPKENATNA
jgi:hypothetical protein